MDRSGKVVVVGGGAGADNDSSESACDTVTAPDKIQHLIGITGTSHSPGEESGGVGKFQLGKYRETVHPGDVAKSSTVMLLFTIKKGVLPPGLAETHSLLTVKVAIYLNILGVVVLTESSDLQRYPVGSQEVFNDLGVDVVNELEDQKGKNLDVLI